MHTHTQTEKQDIERLWNTHKRCNICITGRPEVEKRKEQKTFERVRIKNFLQINVGHQTTHPGSMEHQAV